MESGLCLDRNERAVPFSSKVLRDIQKIITSPALNYYPEPTSLYKQLARHYKFSEEQLYLVNGITEGIRVLYETLSQPGGNVVIIDPTFPMYHIYAKIYQAEYRPVGYTDNLKLQYEDFFKWIDSKTAFVCVPNPNLPIESYLTIKQIEKLARWCRQREIMVVVDEAYGFFGAQSAMNLVSQYDNLIVMQTFSKAWGLAGIRLGVMISSPPNIDYLSKTRSLVESNGVSMAIAEYMLKHPFIMTQYVQETIKGRDYIQSELRKLGLKVFGGQHTNALLIFLKDRESVHEAVEYLKKRKIYIRASFERPLDRCLRLTLGPREVMGKFLKAFTQWLKDNPNSF